MEDWQHYSVMKAEVLRFLRPAPGRVYVDATLGAGGHAEGILKISEPDGHLLGLDLDPWALEIARRRLKLFGARVTLINENFTNLPEVLRQQGIRGADGIVMDLGLSSLQLADQVRGFSFQTESDLDMRMDPAADLRAWDLVNKLPEPELANLLWRFGEERSSRAIARAIVKRRKQSSLNTTGELRDTVLGAIPGSKRTRKLHPATKTFMALRIAVNRELDNLTEAVPKAISTLNSGGRLVIISFNSLEDRIVKEAFRLLSGRCQCPPDAPQCSCGACKLIRIITKKPERPEAAEVAANPPSRSAKLRAAEKL